MRALAGWIVAFAALACSAHAQSQPTVAFKTDIEAAKSKANAGNNVAQGSTNTAAANLGVNEKLIDSAVQDILWAGPDGSGIILILSAGNTLYRSSDGGKTWINQESRIISLAFGDRKPGSTTGPFGVTSMVKSPADPNFILLTGTNGAHVVTRDAGATYTAVTANALLGEFRLHPTNTDLMLAAALTGRCGDARAGGACYKQLFASRDGGSQWKMLRSYVVQFDWARGMKNGQGDIHPEEAVVFSALTEAKGNQRFGKWDQRVDLYFTPDLFDSETLLVERGNRFLFTDQYVAVARVDKASRYVQLVLSGNGATPGSFREVGMPYDIGQHSYTILDTSEGTVFLHVNHNGDGAKWGNVYTSNAIGTNFSLSLPYNRRDQNGKCDFEKLQSMEGVYVANYYDNAAALEKRGQHMAAGSDSSMGQATGKTSKSKGKQAATLKKVVPIVRTVITFDKGAVWEYLNPPKSTVTGTRSACDKGKHCSLHLHGVTDVFGPFYSTPTAVGLLMATGCVGDRLCFREGTIDTYLSRDGGHEWFEVAKGSHIYEIGDHGGLIVMAYDEQPTTLLLYSWNEGETWESHDFSETPVLVDNIMTEPGSTSTRFLLYGTREAAAGGRIGVVFHVDFSELHQRVCQGVEIAGAEESDYELWSPSQGPNQEGCLLGHQVDYTRRKRGAQCFNGEELERHTTVRDCECTELDYECDVGYKRTAIGETTCVPDPDVVVDPSTLVPIRCPPGSTYEITQGYRRVSGDTCKGGVQHPARVLMCPNSSLFQHLAPSRWFVLLLALGIVVGLCYAQFGRSSGGFSGTGGVKGHPSGARSWLGAVVGTATGLAEAAGAMVRALAARVGLGGAGGRQGGFAGSAAPRFGGSTGAQGDASSSDAVAYRPMAQGGEDAGSAEAVAWEDGDEELAFGEDEDGVGGGSGAAGDEFGFGEGDDDLDRAIADLGRGGTEEDLLGVSAAAVPSPAQVPKLRAPRKAE